MREGACITGLSWILPPALLVLLILPRLLFLVTALPRGDVELVVLADVEGEQEHVGGKVVVHGGMNAEVEAGACVGVPGPPT